MGLDNRDFHAPSSPLPKDGAGNLYTLANKMPGQVLFDHIAEFYAWYGAWDSFPKRHARTYEYFTRIMRIAHVSLSGGNFLKNIEEQNALKASTQLREKLYDSNIKPSEMPRILLQILHNLTEHNPKAKLIALATELEYLICINPGKKYPPELVDEFQKTLNFIVDKIQYSPHLPEIHAQAIAQGIAQLLETPPPLGILLKALQESMKGWFYADQFPMNF